MVVQIESERVVAARQMVIELLLASGNHNCLICEANITGSAASLAMLCGNVGIEGDRIRVRSRRGEITAKAQISGKAVPGTIRLTQAFCRSPNFLDRFPIYVKKDIK